jgi:DNA-binding MarR family transcriptional regulator
MVQDFPNTGVYLWQLQHHLQLKLETRIARLQLTLPQVATLMRLAAEPGIRGSDLAKQLLLTPQAVSLIIGKLADAGYLDRSAPNVGRSQPLATTSKGRKALKSAQAIIDAVHEEVFGVLNETEQAHLHELLQRTLAAVHRSRTHTP